MINDSGLRRSRRIRQRNKKVDFEGSEFQNSPVWYNIAIKEF